MPIRCEASVSPDGSGVKFATQDEEAPYPEINEWPHKWEKPILSYRLNNLSPDIQKEEHQVRAVTVAFRCWQLRVRNIKFKRHYPMTDPVDIEIWFRGQEEFSSEGVLAHAYYPGQSSASGGH